MEYILKKFKNEKTQKRIFIVVLIGVTLFRIWLASGFPYLIRNWNQDDFLQLTRGLYIFNGQWMGPYSNITLAKGPGFPIFLALIKFLQIPYGTAIGIVIALSSGIFVLAIKPIFKNKWICALIFIVLLYCPVSFYSLARVYRNVLSPWIVLLIIASIVGIYARIKDKPQKWIFWGIVGFVSTGWFWILREDSLWMLPFLIASGLIIVIDRFVIIPRGNHQNSDALWPINTVISTPVKILFGILMAFLAFSPVLGIASSTSIVKMINQRTYGVAVVNDRTQSNCAEVMRLLYQIDSNEPDRVREIWVSRKMIQMASNVSPSFAKLNVIKQVERWYGVGNDAESDIIEWVMRDSVADAGHYRDGAETDQYYGQIVQELQSAYDSGKLKKRDLIYLSSQIAGMEVSDIIANLGDAAAYLWEMGNYYDARIPNERLNYSHIYDPHEAEESNIVMWEEFFGMGIPRSDNQLAQINADPLLIETNKAVTAQKQFVGRLYNKIVKVYRAISPIAFVMSMLAFAFLTIRLIRQREREDFAIWIVMLGIFLTVFLEIYSICLWGFADVEWEHTLESVAYYGSPANVLMTVFYVFGIFALARCIKEWFTASRSKKA